jgi:hypothetical protein
MKNPKTHTPPMILMGLIILILIGGCVRQPDPSGSYLEIPQNPTSTHVAATPENLQFIDFHFTPIDLTDNRLKNAISQDQAVLAALQFEPAGKNASSVTTQVGFSDGAMVLDLSNDRLIWLVTFHGVDSISSGPPDSIHRVAHELTIAVDAYKGNGIVSMTLGIVTPQAEIIPTTTQVQTISSTSQSSQPSRTLSPTFGPRGFSSPSTILAYIADVQLGQTTRIEFFNPVSHKQIVITTKQTIQAIVALLSSATDHCVGTPEDIGNGFMFIMVGPGDGNEHSVSVDYHPSTSDVFLDNITTGDWPVKFQGTYSVCPDFGSSLFELLGIDI